jgi:hypothetical protein
VFKALIPAAIASFMAFAPAHAAPISATSGMSYSASSAELLQVADRDRDGIPNRFDNRDNRKRVYVPGRRYDRAPNGWNRYGRRPGDWRSRRCIMVGPVWFCP